MRVRARVLVDGCANDQVSAMDRGLAYGDGLFETIRFVGVDAPLWRRHMRRLDEGCHRLRLALPDPAVLWSEALAVSTDMAHSVVRITVTRGMGTRGYAPAVNAAGTRIVAAFAPPMMTAASYVQGVQLRVCDVHLAAQPLLAGIKHLNRLEQVLARAEWTDPAIADGLLCDRHDHVISATAANLFAVIEDQLRTPAVDRCGVAGVGRAEVLAICPQTRVGPLSLVDLQDAREVFLSSSVRGILPVRALAGHHYQPGVVARRLQQHWRELGFPMEHIG